MTDIVEEARALLAQVKDDPYPFDCDEPRDDAKRLLAALADECERLRAENARLREAMPSDEEWSETTDVCVATLHLDIPLFNAWLARVGAAKGGK